MHKYLYEDLTFRIIGACFEVYNNMGCGFLEAVYQECLTREFTSMGIDYCSQKKLDIYYKNEKLDQYYIADFICWNKIIIEIKALSKLQSEHYSQPLNYLKATGLNLSLLFNFGNPDKLEYKRIIKTA